MQERQPPWTGPFEIINAGGAAPVVLACDHASNALPPALAGFGVPAAGMERHIAWDIGAAVITRSLSQIFDAPAILCGTSRLVIDCNRQLSDPTLIPAISDGTPIPGNMAVDAAAREARIRDYFLPYHAACRKVLDAQCAGGRKPLFVAVHSMTERMNGIDRPWEIALSSGRNRAATDAVLAALRKVPGLCVGDNEPYDMDPAQDYSTPEHALSRGLPYVQVEFRQDIVATPEGQQRYANIFAQALCAAFPALASYAKVRPSA
jgi:predicted N-formylglutamate amidohydrolase